MLLPEARPFEAGAAAGEPPALYEFKLEAPLPLLFQVVAPP
jgi:hypothetical protein